MNSTLVIEHLVVMLFFSFMNTRLPQQTQQTLQTMRLCHYSSLLQYAEQKSMPV